jgi:tetratricopeptide (TPR) repeat protein
MAGWPLVAPTLAAAWVACLAWQAFGQTRNWRDDEAFAVGSVAVSPESSPAWSMLAAVQVARRQPREAVQSAGRALDLDPHNENALINIASAFAISGEHQQAAAALKSAAARTRAPSRWIVATYNLGRLMLDLDRNGEAAAAFAEVLHRVPVHAAARRGLGVALTRLGELGRAVEIFRRAVADDPEDAAAWVGLGNALHLLERPDEAVACYDRALIIDPDDAGTLVNRAWARVAAGDVGKAAADVARLGSLGRSIPPDLLDAVRSRSSRSPRVVPKDTSSGGVP